MKKVAFLFSLLLTTTYPLHTAYAYDPLSVPNNKFGIHLIQPTNEESSPAAQLVNTNGDWGYITIVMEYKDRDDQNSSVNKDKWQQFFDDLRRRHLIPIIRLATMPQSTGGYSFWKRPDEEDAQKWANFLDSLNWPVKNRYVVVYNEPNHGSEWGGLVDAKSYAKILDQTVTAVKNKNRDFFILNAGFDAASPSKLPDYEDEVKFMREMERQVPGIFEKLDGFASHSYPASFVGLPQDIGRTSVRTWYWEIQQLRNLGVVKNLPIFITETGWKHAEGLKYDPNLPKQEEVAKYFEQSFADAFISSRVIAVTPFLLSYQEFPFDHFSFKKPDGTFYAMFEAIKNLPKIAGQPLQTLSAKLVKGEVYSSIVAGETYQISLTFKNTGQSIWNDRDSVNLVPLSGGFELGINAQEIPKNITIEPGKDYTFNIQIKAPQKGSFKVALNLFHGNNQFESEPVQFLTEVKLPVILQVLTALKWKKTAQGEYILGVSGIVGDSSQKIILGSDGRSKSIEARHLLPDYAFDFTLERSYYHSKTIHQTVKPGVNVLDFGTLQPSLLPALLHPSEFWRLLPWSN